MVPVGNIEVKLGLPVPSDRRCWKNTKANTGIVKTEKLDPFCESHTFCNRYRAVTNTTTYEDIGYHTGRAGRAMSGRNTNPIGHSLTGIYIFPNTFARIEVAYFRHRLVAL